MARKVIKLLRSVFDLTTELTVRRSVLHKSNNYLITVVDQQGLTAALTELGILDEDHSPLYTVPALARQEGLLRDRVSARHVPRRRVRRRSAR